ncbi:MAG: threonine-phosphate decarboxylase [Sinobacteraceae bacterium]|nr:threonine-phosphate decarboxylase [Nevskiaceae bacterium]
MSFAGFAHHGGRLGAARAAYSHAPQPWIDLSTGINPRSYPTPRARGVVLNRLPDTGELSRLETVAATAFGVSDPQRVVATGGTEPALRLLPYVLGQKNAVIAGPTYGSHADGWRSAGVPTRVLADSQLEDSLGCLTAVVVVNPNNPDGRLLGRCRLQRLHDGVASRGGVLVVDEAFGEVAPDSSVAGIAGTSGAEWLLVLRSFGKFYGLAGLRLGFVVGAAPLMARVRSVIGDWPVSVDALVAGLAAYADHQWAERTRVQLARSARRLDGLLVASGFEIVGGTSLYRLARADDAAVRFERLAAAGILTRPFQHDASLLRFGLPGSPEAWRRLQQALSSS